jgi:chondroitin synthase
MSNFNLLPVIGLANDYTFVDTLKKHLTFDMVKDNFVSIIIPYYKKMEELKNTLLGLSLQTFPCERMDIMVINDGSDDSFVDLINKYEKTFFSFRVIHQDRQGYRLSHARNLGMKSAHFDKMIILDADMMPTKDLVLEHMYVLALSNNVLSIGFRTNIDMSKVDANGKSNLIQSNIEGDDLDFRYQKHLKNEDSIKTLKFGDTYWSILSGGNTGFTKRVLDLDIFFDEDFNDWGGEDTEWAYRLYKFGFYFYPNTLANAIHQDGLDGYQTNREYGREKNKEILHSKCPRLNGFFSQEPFSTFNTPNTPFVSFWITCSNRVDYILDAIQSLKDIPYKYEIIIVDDGSIDESIVDVLSKFPNTCKILSRKKRGVACTYSDALALCEGEFLAQLDSDDTLPNIKNFSKLLFSITETPLGLVYGHYDTMDVNGVSLGNKYKYPYCDRYEAIFESMKVHPMRVIRMRDLKRSRHLNEKLVAAIDFDLYSKLLEISYGTFVDVHSYNYRIHKNSISFGFDQGVIIDSTQRVVKQRVVDACLYDKVSIDFPKPKMCKITDNRIDSNNQSVCFLHHLQLSNLANSMIFAHDTRISLLDLIDNTTKTIDTQQKQGLHTFKFV